MADTTGNFRSAFHGFNREDVIHFLETLTTRHATQTGQLRDDIKALETQLEQAKQESTEAHGQRDDAWARVEELRAEITARETELEDSRLETEMAEEERKTLQAQLTAAQSELETLRARLAAVQAEKTRLEEHQDKVSALAQEAKAELESMRLTCEELASRAAEAQTQTDKATARADAAEKRAKTLEAELEALRAETESLRTRTVAKSASPLGGGLSGAVGAGWAEAELAAYRRAEAVERQAKSRTAQLYAQAAGLVADLSVRLASDRESVEIAAQAVGSALVGLQEALSNGQSTLLTGEASLRALKPEE